MHEREVLQRLFAVKLSLDHIMKYQCLRKMLEWRMEIERGWSVKPGSCGKGLKEKTDPTLWAALESTYVGAGTEENWEALFRTIGLFRQVAVEVGERLGYAYPYEQDRLVVAYLDSVRRDRALAIHAPLFRKVDCVRLAVPDLEAGLSFYRDRLGLALIWRTVEAAGLRLPETDAEIVLHKEPGPPEVDLLVDSADEAAARLTAAGGRRDTKFFEFFVPSCLCGE